MPKYTDNDIDEDMKLTRSDYLKILHHYQPDTRKMPVSRLTTKYVKERAHRILADKLCRCVKQTRTSDVDANEGRSIAYCTRSIFNNRCLRHHGFRCKTQTGRRSSNKRRTLRPRLINDLTKTCRRLRL